MRSLDVKSDGSMPGRSLLLGLALGGAALLAAGCGGASTPAEDPGGAGDPAASGPSDMAPVEGSASEPAAPGAPAGDAPAAAPKKEARNADESDPEGLPAIKPDERKVLDGDCKKFTDAVAKAIAKKKPAPGETRADQVVAALEKPPTVQGVDGAKCADLMRRDVLIYAARQAESEAKNNLKLVAVNIGVAFENDKNLCPSAGPTPASLDALQKGPATTTANDWMAPGWSCTRFGPSAAPTRWQYELKTDKGRGTWEVIARGYPVAGGPPTELFLEGVVDAGGVTPPGSVKRR